MFRHSLLFFLLLAVSPLTWAGPPFFTDDPEPVALRHWEIYTAADAAKTTNGWSGAAPLFDINYGVTRNAHFHLLVQSTFQAPDHGNTLSGAGDTEIGAKIRFLDETDTHPQAAIYPTVEMPTGDETKGLGAGHTQFFLPLWIQKTWDKWLTYGGGGYWVNPGDSNKNWVYLGWAVQREIFKRAMIGAEIFHRTAATVDGSASDGFSVGTGYDVNSRYHLLFSAGRDWNGPNRFTSYAAIQWTYPDGK